MIESNWRRIAGIHLQDNSEAAAVWAAHDKETDVVHLYDCCMFRKEVLPVIADGLNARGRWIPIAWSKSADDMSKELLNRGCNMLYAPLIDSPAFAEIVSREVWERMRTGRFKVDLRLKEWHDEYKGYFKDGNKLPVTGFPLMAATRHAVSQIAYAKRLQTRKEKPTNYPKLAMI